MQGISFPEADRQATAVKVTWGDTAHSGRALTGYGLLFWRKGATPPAYSRALVKRASARSHTYTGLQPNTTYQFRIHACNGPDSCGWWTHPPKEVTTKAAPPTVTAPGRVRNLRFSKDHASFTVHACNGRDRCGAWTRPTAVTTDPAPSTSTPAPTAQPTPTGPLHSVTIAQEPPDSASLKATWMVTRTTGLTRFQVQRRRITATDDWPPVIQAARVAVVDGQTRYQYTYDGLQYLITYRVRVRACTGPNDATDCAGWVESNDVRMRGVIVPRPPGAVRDVRFADRTATSFKVTWNAPADPGTGITGYGLQHKLGDDPWPRASRVVVVGATPRAWTFRGLSTGTHWVRIQACSGKNTCYPWASTKGHKVKIPPTDEVQDLRATAGVGQLMLSWQAPADTGGKTITRYLVQYRIQGDAAWTTWPHTVIRSPVTLDNLRNETTYDVQVRACYNANNAECGTAAHTTGRPTAGEPGPGPGNLGNPSPPRRISGCGSSAPGALASPKDLEITPYPQRRALLTWVGSEAATHYKVDIFEVGIAARLGSYEVRKPCWQINLDSIWDVPDSRGLAHADFRFQVTARTKALVSGTLTVTDSQPSEIVTLVDNPIVSINGNSKNTQDGKGQAAVRWSEITGATHYTIMYRELPGFHWSPGWTVSPPTASHPRTSIEVAAASAVTDPNDNTRLTYTIGGTTNTANPLTRNELYAVSINYQKQGVKYFAAREAYVWPSARRADNGERVGSFPLVQMIPNNTYKYHICEDTFPAGTLNVRREAWVSLITDAVEQWASASQGLITGERVDEPCVSFDSVVTQIESDIRRHIAKWPDLSDEKVREFARALITRLRRTGAVRSTSSLLANRNEILMYNDVDGALAYFREVDVFPELASDLGYRCWHYDREVQPDIPNIPMCTQSDYREGSWRSDIIVRRSLFEDDRLLMPKSNARFNTCPRTQPGHGYGSATDGVYKAFTIMVHEVGHALGIRGGPGIVWTNRGHPQVPDSVMNYDHVAVSKDPERPPLSRADFDGSFSEPDCTPHPLDVMAIYALYQTN